MRVKNSTAIRVGDRICYFPWAYAVGIYGKVIGLHTNDIGIDADGSLGATVRLENLDGSIKGDFAVNRDCLRFVSRDESERLHQEQLDREHDDRSV